LPYRYLEDVAIADLAFQAEADSLEGLFEEAAKAVMEAMANTSTLDAKGTTKISVQAENVEDLLYKFLSQIVYLKDAEAILFKEIRVSIAKDGGYSLTAEGVYDNIDPSRQELRMDVKAVTYHMFSVAEERGHWKCTVVVDI